MGFLSKTRKRMLNHWRPHRTSEGRLALLLEHLDIATVIDVGANRGQTGRSLRMGGYKGAILSIEPGAAAYEALQDASTLDRDWRVAPRTAVGSHDGLIELNVSAADDLSSVRDTSSALREMMPAAATVGREQVPLTRLDTLIQQEQPLAPWFVKIDTQGFEAEVLDGCDGALDRIKGFKLELSLTPLYVGEKTHEYFYDWMRRHGYEPWLVEPVSYLRDRHRQLQVDAVFVRPGAGI